MYGLFAFVFQNSFLLRGVILFGVGITIGSMLNIVVRRLPIILEQRWEKYCAHVLKIDQTTLTKNSALISTTHQSSYCTICMTKIPLWANIPILGYLLQNGRCGNCKTIIPIRYPLVELVTGLLFVVAAYFSNDTLILPAHLIFISFVLCLILIDYDNMILPNELTIPLLWLGLLFNLHGLISGSLTNSLYGAIIGYVFLWLVFWGFKLITGREGIGYGDFKFLAAILAWIGYIYIVPMLLIASGLGIIYFIIMQIKTKITNGAVINNPHIPHNQLPFGPFLGIAGIFLLIFGKYIKLFFNM